MKDDQKLFDQNARVYQKPEYIMYISTSFRNLKNRLICTIEVYCKAVV